MYFKKLNAIVSFVLTISHAINVSGQDTIPPKILIDETQLKINYSIGTFGDDVYYSPLSDDTLEVTLSCIYLFPEDYYFKLENAVIVDDSGFYKDTITTDKIIFYENGYGTVIQTIIAEDPSGNISKFVIISQIGSIYSFNIISMKVGSDEILYDINTSTLEKTEVEICDVQNVDFKLIYSKNGCTGGVKIDWYINNDLVIVDSDNFSLDMRNESDAIELAAEVKNSRLKINIQKISNQGIIEKYDPTCLNSNDGIINLSPEAFNVNWKHDGSNTRFLNSLNTGIYYVSYTYKECEFTDSIKLNPKKILSFEISDTTIDLNQNDTIRITNTSVNIDESLWQIGDDSFINNNKEFKYVFKSPGKIDIKLMDNSGFCNDSIVKNVRVEKSTLVTYNSIPSVKIGPNPFTDDLNIDMEKSLDYDITILGIDGRVCYKNRFFDMVNNKLNLSFLTPGIYVLNINSTKNSEPVKDFKIVKLVGN